MTAIVQSVSLERHKLAEMSGERKQFVGTFVRTGVKDGYKGPLETVLLRDIKHGEEVVTDHLWFNRTKGFRQAGLKAGDRVQFSARCEDYVKGYLGRDEERQIMYPPTRDWHLCYPTRIKNLRQRAAS